MSKIKVALADDHALFREGLKAILSRLEGIEVVIEVGDGKELLKAMAIHEVDVVLLDLEMPEMDGMEACKEIKKLYPNVNVLILTMHEEERMTAYLMEMGANGYLLKNTKRDVLLEAIHTVHETGMYSSDRVTNALLKSLRQRSKKTPGLGAMELTRREQEVLALIAEELTNTEIGERLFISEKTVDGHRMNLLSKFGVRNTAGLILKAVRQGFISV
ncbi:MAG: response regulator transcription factor [Roseivirga sp.]|nr:response regulator transcription factor [Roseivirga sp.]